MTPIVLDRGNEIILANWPNDKHNRCNCYPMNLCINCMLHMEAYQTYNSLKLCILYHF